MILFRVAQGWEYKTNPSLRLGIDSGGLNHLGSRQGCGPQTKKAARESDGGSNNQKARRGPRARGLQQMAQTVPAVRLQNQRGKA